METDIALKLIDAHARNPEHLSQQDKAEAEAKRVAILTGRYTQVGGKQMPHQNFVKDYVELYFRHEGF